MKALLDTCVILDVLQKREPFYKNAMDIVLAVSNRQCIGVITAKAITDIHYILHRSIRNEAEVRKWLNVLFTLFDVADTFSDDCRLALASQMKDYEDAVMAQTALRVGADCIVTRNLKDYYNAGVTVYAPDEFLNKLNIM